MEKIQFHSTFWRHFPRYDFAIVMQKSCDMFNGMKSMIHRTTFALDEQSVQRLKRLSSRWHVSQAEVVRRSLEQAEKSVMQSEDDPVDLLTQLHADGAGLVAEDAARYIADVREDRAKWRS